MNLCRDCLINAVKLMFRILSIFLVKLSKITCLNCSKLQRNFFIRIWFENCYDYAAKQVKINEENLCTDNCGKIFVTVFSYASSFLLIKIIMKNTKQTIYSKYIMYTVRDNLKFQSLFRDISELNSNFR